MADPHLETRIWMAMKGIAQSAIGGIPTSWPGEVEAPVRADEKYVDVSYILARPQPTVLRAGGKHERRATLQMSLMYPLSRRENINEVSLQIAAGIASAVPQSRDPHVFRDVRLWVTEAPHVMEGYREDGYWVVSVRVRLVCQA